MQPLETGLFFKIRTIIKKQKSLAASLWSLDILCFFPMEIYPTGGKEKCSICLEHGRLLIYPYFPSYQKFTEAVTITAYNCSPENKKCNNNQQAELEPF